MDYERGLETLKQLAQGTDWYKDISPHDAVLLDTLHYEYLYGRASQTSQELYRAVDMLNRLSLEHLGISYTDLCLGKQPAQPIQHTQASHSVTSPRPLRTSVFISYSRKDKRYLEELHTHLAYYVRKEALNFWDDTMIPPGSNWRRETEKALQSAKVIVLLISPDYLASDFIVNHDLPLALAGAEQEGTIILPVILRRCAFKDTELAQYQAVADPSTPLSEMKPAKRDAVWLKVVECIRDALNLQR